MAVSYKRFRKLLIDRDMKKSELCKLSGISNASIKKMRKNDCITTDVLNKIMYCVRVQY